MSVASLLIRISADARDVKGGVSVAVREFEKLQDRVSGLGSNLSNLFPPSMTTSVKQVGTAVGSLVGAFGGLGGAIAALGIGAAANDFLDTTGALSDLSAQTDITTKDLQRFQHAGDLVGVSLDSIVGAVGQLQNRLGSGDKGAFAALETLGVTFRDLQRLDPGQQFETIASAISKIRDPAQRAAVAMDLFGRSGVQLLPLLRSNLKEAGDQAFILSDRIVETGDKFGDVLTRAENFGKALIGNIFGPVVVWVDDTREALEDLGRTFDTIRGKAEKLPEIGAVTGFKGAGVRDPTMGFEEAMRLSDELDRKIQQSIEQRTRQQQMADDVLRRSAESLVDRVKANTDAEFKNGIAIRRVTLELLENARAQSNQIGVVDRLTDSWLAAADAAEAFNDQIRIGLDSAPGFSVDIKALAGSWADVGRESKTSISTLDRNLQALGGTAMAIGGQFDGLFGTISDGIGRTILDFKHFKAEGVSTFEKVAAAAQGAASVWQASGAPSRGSAVGGSALAGAQAGAAFGPWGIAIGGAAGAIVGLIRSAGQGREAVEAFAKSFGGFDNLQKKLEPLGAEGERLWKNLTQGVGKNNPQQAQAAIDAITAALEKQKAVIEDTPASYDDIVAAAERYGIEVNKLGDAVNGLRVTETADQAVQDWNLLAKSGADVEEVARGMADEFQALVIESLKWGHSLPESIRPILERMRDMGLLTDDAGEKLTDLDKLNWDEPVKDSVDGLKDSFGVLKDVINDVAVALRNLPSQVSVGIDAPDIGARQPALALVSDEGPTMGAPISGAFGGSRDDSTSEIRGMRADLRRLHESIPRAVRDAVMLGAA